MPLYDDIADALELTADGAQHTISLDNQGATCQTNEASFGECQWGAFTETVWAKVDLSGHPTGTTVDIPIDLVRTGGGGAFSPEFAVFKVVDASFDPTSPDFSKLDYLPGQSYIGDGTTNPAPATLSVTGGIGDGTGTTSASGVFWLAFNDYNYAEYGTGNVTYTVPPAPVCINAVDVINPDSNTASVVSGRVREDWLDWWDFGSNGYNLPEKTLKFTWADDAGLYKMSVAGQLSAGGSGVVNAIATVNGRPFIAVGGVTFNNTTPDSFYAYNGFDFATPDVYDPSDYATNPWLVLSPGDLVEIQILSGADLTGFTGFNPFECSQVCFIKDDAAPSSTYCTGAVRFDDAPLGDDWGDIDGWGGQQFIPDEIYAWLGVGPNDPHTIGVDFPWGVAYTDYDFVALEDGTVYVLFHDARNFPGGTPSAENHYLVIKKYDPTSNGWTQLATLNRRNPTDHYPIDSAACEYDGTYVYFVWWEMHTYTPGIPTRYLWKWHCIRLDPTNDSMSELGSGQNAEGVTINRNNLDMLGTEGTTLGHSIAFSGGDVYVANIEIPDIAWGPSDFYRRRPYVWRWDGSSWTNIAIPDPSQVASPPNAYEVHGENQFWDVLVNLIAANAAGPKNNGVTAIYTYIYFDSGDGYDHYPLFTIEYTVGSGWSGETISDIATIEYNAGNRAGGTYLAWRSIPIDLTPLWSDKLGKLVLVGDLLGNYGYIWDMFQFGASDWEIINAIAPASSSGPWRQSRNSAAIGPDGDIWRGLMADEIDGFDFEPHVAKHSPGYAFGFANGARKPIGDIDSWTDPQGNVWSGSLAAMYATTNYRIRWVGNSCYIMANLYIEPQLANGDLFADSTLYPNDWPYGEGFYIIKGTYVGCGRRPQFYRRAFG